MSGKNKGPSISIAADTKEAQAAIKDGIIEPLEDARDVIADLATDSKKLDKLETTMEDAADETKRVREELDKLDKSTKDAASTAKKYGDNFKEGTDKASKGLDDLQQNSKSNAKEVAASFDGSIESIGDGFQGLAAEAFEGWGPAGVVAGAAVAAGIGLAMQKIEEANARAEKFRETVSELSEELITAGADGEISYQYIADRLMELATSTDESITSLKEIKEIAKDTGTDFEKLALYYAGATDGIDELIASNKELANEYDASATLQENRIRGISEETRQREEMVRGLEESRDAMQQAQEAEALAAEASVQASQVRAEAVSLINDAYDEAVNNVSEFIDSETGIFDITAYAASIEARKKMLFDYQTALATSGLTPEQKAALNAMGIDQASAILAGLSDPNVDAETKRTVTESLTEAAKESSGQAKDVIEKAFEQPTKTTVEVDLDKTKADKDIADILKRRQLEVMVTYVGRDGRPVD